MPHGQKRGPLARRGHVEGGIVTPGGSVRGWRWCFNGVMESAAIRCRGDQWYVVRASTADARPAGTPPPVIAFADEGGWSESIPIALLPDDAAGESAWIGWVRAPDHSTHLRVGLPGDNAHAALKRLTLHAVIEPDPKCHPAAHTPRWSTLLPPFPVDRVVIPESLEALEPLLPAVRVDRLSRPRSLRALAASAIGAACVVSPDWVTELGLSLKDLERVAAGSILILDLPTLAALLERESPRCAPLVRVSAAHEICAARVQYSDVATRGFALMDVFPYGTRTADGGFSTRAIRFGRGWRSVARPAGWVELLTSETHDDQRSGDVLVATRAVEMGELMGSDTPWIAAGALGAPAAPRLATLALRAQLGQPIEDFVQYWARCSDAALVVRDIADLTRRYASLRAVRWSDGSNGAAQLGLSIDAGSQAPHFMLRTGSIDPDRAHDGLPPEPMMILLRWLLREIQDATPLARKALCGRTIAWQFDTVAGRRYAPLYDSAAGLVVPREEDTLTARVGNPSEPAASRGRCDLVLPASRGLFGDDSAVFQSALTRGVRAWLESRARPSAAARARSER